MTQLLQANLLTPRYSVVLPAACSTRLNAGANRLWYVANSSTHCSISWGVRLHSGAGHVSAIISAGMVLVSLWFHIQLENDTMPLLGQRRATLRCNTSEAAPQTAEFGDV